MSSTGPTAVLNIKLKGLGSVKSSEPQEGHLDDLNWSAFHLALQFLQSIKGSVNVSWCPENLRTLGFVSIDASKPSTSSLSKTIDLHQDCLRLFFSSTPKGP